MSPNHYIEDLRAERDALRAVVARVEALAAEYDDGPGWVEATYHGHVVRQRILQALGSTDSDPAATGRQGEAEGAGDHV